jgi:hypothetical protein
MQFLSRLIGTAPQVSRTRTDDRPSRRRRAQFSLETLEDRDLKTGVSLAYGALQITDAGSGNKTEVSIDQSNGNLKVDYNGTSAEFNSGSVWSISYDSGQSGGNTFVNNSGYSDNIKAYGGGNTIVGSSSFNYVEMHGDNNVYSAQGGSYVFAYGGPNNHIAASGNTYVWSYDYDFSASGWGSW